MVDFKEINDEFNNVMSVDCSGLYLKSPGVFAGTIQLELDDKTEITITGEHGENDYVEEYGFQLIWE